MSESENEGEQYQTMDRRTALKAVGAAAVGAVGVAAGSGDAAAIDREAEWICGSMNARPDAGQWPRFFYAGGRDTVYFDTGDEWVVTGLASGGSSGGSGGSGGLPPLAKPGEVQEVHDSQPVGGNIRLDPTEDYSNPSDAPWTISGRTIWGMGADFGASEDSPTINFVPLDSGGIRDMTIRVDPDAINAPYVVGSDTTWFSWALEKYGSAASGTGQGSYPSRPVMQNVAILGPSEEELKNRTYDRVAPTSGFYMHEGGDTGSAVGLGFYEFAVRGCRNGHHIHSDGGHDTGAGFINGNRFRCGLFANENQIRLQVEDNSHGIMHNRWNIESQPGPFSEHLINSTVRGKVWQTPGPRVGRNIVKGNVWDRQKYQDQGQPGPSDLITGNDNGRGQFRNLIVHQNYVTGEENIGISGWGEFDETRLADL